MSHLATTAVPWICELQCFVGCRAARDVHVALVAVSLRRTNEEDIAGTKDRGSLWLACQVQVVFKTVGSHVLCTSRAQPHWLSFTCFYIWC